MEMQSLHSMQATHSEPAAHATTRIAANNQQQQQMHIQSQTSSALKHDLDEHHQQLQDDSSVGCPSSMTILEPVQQQQQQQQQQPTLSALNPVLQAPPLIHHMAQQQQQQQPHLHQLQAPGQQQTNEMLQIGHADHEQQQQIANSPHQDHQQNSTRSNHQRANHSIDGIVPDGGGPIAQWLLDNYEIADGRSLPRSTVYNHYQAHCRQLQMSSVNAASFGKLIRSVFVGLKTRRLGTRGHSKYHYFGIQAKQHARGWIRELEDNEQNHHSHLDHHHHHHHHPNHHHHQSMHETGVCNGHSDTRTMTDTTNGSESDSMECSGGGGSSSQTSKQFKRHNASGYGHEQRNEANSSSQQMLALRHGAFLDSGASSGLVAEPGCTHHHHHPATENDNQHNHHNHHQSATDLMYTNGYGAYYGSTAASTPTNGLFCNSIDHQATNMMHPDMSDKGAVGAGTSWPSATATTTMNHNNSSLYDCSEVPDSDFSHLRGYFGDYSSLVNEVWCLVSSDAERQTNGSKIKNEGEQDQFKHRFETQYKRHMKRFVEHLETLDFSALEDEILDFWQSRRKQVSNWSTNISSNNGEQNNPKSCPDGALDSHNLEDHLSLEQLKEITSSSSNVSSIIQINRRLYQFLETYLIPSLFTQIPRQLTQILRKFTIDLPSWLENSIKDYPNHFRTEASKAVRDFAHSMRRYVSINYLASASRAIWTRRSALSQMSLDLSRIDLRDVEHQVSLMMQQQQLEQRQNHCEQARGFDDHNFDNRLEETQSSLEKMKEITGNNDSECVGTHQQIIIGPNQDQELFGAGTNNSDQSLKVTFEPAQLVQSFMALLEDHEPTSVWPSWCQQLVEKHVSGQSFDEAQNFFLRWNFYISLILKELTLKSAHSLGSFQLIRLLFDEYIYHLVVSKLAHVQDPKNPKYLLLRPSSRFAAGND